MNYATVCSGIGAPEAAWEPMGWRCAFQSEIEPFPCAVLKHHYPNVPNYGDMTNWRNWPDANIDVLCGGTPCQSFSVAGLRGGMAHRSTVRRLTPRERERLQGFPDDYTLIQYRGKPAADGPRYKAIGNSMAVPVLAWIGRRIKDVDALCAREENIICSASR